MITKRNIIILLILFQLILNALYYVYHIKFKNELQDIIYVDQHPEQVLYGNTNDKLGIILTAFFTSKKDPQRGIYVQPDIDYIRNWYITVKYWKLNAIIFHDGLSEGLINLYETNNIKFIQTEKWNTSFGINDHRFFIFNNWLRSNESKSYKYVLLADADVFWWHNPFDYMNASSEYDLFASHDVGTITSNGWVEKKFQKCYGHVPNGSLNVENDGLWGGKIQAVKFATQCMTNQFLTKTIGKGNCNMVVYNWCLNNDNNLIHLNINKKQKSKFANPFRKNCKNKLYVSIHDKCAGGKTVINIANSTLNPASNKNTEKIFH